MSASLRARRDCLRAQVPQDAADGPGPSTATYLARVGRAAQVVALTALLKARKKVTGHAARKIGREIADAAVETHLGHISAWIESRKQGDAA